MAAKLKILVIEDDDKDAELLRRKLQERFDLMIVSTLKQGLAVLAAHQYAAVILDLSLVNGIKDKVLDEVKDVCGEAAVVVLTGDSNPRTRDHMRHRKADAFMVKGREDSREDLVWVLYEAIKEKKRRLEKENRK